MLIPLFSQWFQQLFKATLVVFAMVAASWGANSIVFTMVSAVFKTNHAVFAMFAASQGAVSIVFTMVSAVFLPKSCCLCNGCSIVGC